MPNPRLRLVASASVNRTVPRRLPNRELRTREHLTEKEIERGDVPAIVELGREALPTLSR